MKKYTIAEVCKKLNLSQHTLRYYEKIGLIQIKRKEKTNIREYTEKNIELLEYIKALKTLDFSLEDIKFYIFLKRNDKNTLLERKKILEEQHKKILEKIKFLTQIKTTIEKKIYCIDQREDKNEN